MVKTFAKDFLVREIQPVAESDLISEFDAFWEQVTPEAFEVYIIKTLQQAIKNCHLNLTLLLSNTWNLTSSTVLKMGTSWLRWRRIMKTKMLNQN